MFSRRSRLVALTCALNDAIATTLAFLLAFAVMQLPLLAGKRWLFLVGETWFRTRPGGLRHFVIVGTSTGARELASLLEAGERFGLSLLAFVYTGDQQPSPPLGLRGSY